jgi:site-specific DNA-methyltransferase (adenine-specific)
MSQINKIYNENCVDFMQKLPDNHIDLTVTSPPYDNLRLYDGNISFFNEQVWKDVISELFRVTKDGGTVVWIVNDSTIKGSESGTSFKQALFAIETGFKLHDTMIYAKNSYMPLTHRRYEQAFEYMFIFVKGKIKTFNPIKIPSATAGTIRNRSSAKQNESTYSERCRDEKTIVNAEKQHPNIFYYDVGKNEKSAHNAPFPETLAQDHIASWSNAGDLVFDPFIGSGTTAVVAKKLGRDFLGCDVSSEYCEIANSRLLK